jgi:hypothetical protein
LRIGGASEEIAIAGPQVPDNKPRKAIEAGGEIPAIGHTKDKAMRRSAWPLSFKDLD